VRETDSVFNVMPLKDRLSESNAENRFRTLVLTLFALTAISLAAIGLYGTLSYLVALRNREIGLRVALGALPDQIHTRFLAQGAGISLLRCIAVSRLPLLCPGCSQVCSMTCPGWTLSPTSRFLSAHPSLPPPLPRSPPRALLTSIRWKFYATNSRQSMALISSRLRKCC
jgi:hypothetical protein